MSWLLRDAGAARVPHLRQGPRPRARRRGRPSSPTRARCRPSRPSGTPPSRRPARALGRRRDDVALACATCAPTRRQQVAILALMGAGIAFEQVVLPLSQKYLIDDAIGHGKVSLVAELLGALLVLFVVQGVAGLAKDYLSARTGAQVMSGLRARLFEHLQALSMGFHGRSAVGDLMARFSTDMENVERALTQGLQGFVQAVLGIVVGLVVMFALEWKLSLASIATWFVFVLGPGLIGPRAARASYARQEDVGRVSTAVQENLRGPGRGQGLRAGAPGRDPLPRAPRPAPEERDAPRVPLVALRHGGEPEQRLRAGDHAGLRRLPGHPAPDDPGLAGRVPGAPVGRHRAHPPALAGAGRDAAGHRRPPARGGGARRAAVEVADAPEARPMPPFAREIRFDRRRLQPHARAAHPARRRLRPARRRLVRARRHRAAAARAPR